MVRFDEDFWYLQTVCLSLPKKIQSLVSSLVLKSISDCEPAEMRPAKQNHMDQKNSQTIYNELSINLTIHKGSVILYNKPCDIYGLFSFPVYN